MRIVLLGTGTSFGIPQIGCGCPVCRSEDPRDRRSRTSALIEANGHTILIDTPPELRLQLLAANVDRLDGVLFTHEHADHVAGIDDLRAFSVKTRTALPVYGSSSMAAFLRSAYRYIFQNDLPPIPGTSKPTLDLSIVTPGQAFSIGSVEVRPIEFEHGYSRVLGYRIGGFAYVTDVKNIPADARRALEGVQVLVLNALWWRPHPTHQSIPEAIAVARELGVRRTILTHLTHETGHAELAAALPPGVEPGYDGLTIEITP